MRAAGGGPYRLSDQRQGAGGRERQRERGAALVEFAIVVPLFLLLVFGIIEFGVIYNDLLAVRSGAREGARLGVVNAVDNAPSCKINGTLVTPPANPTTTTDATNALVCKTKDRVGLGSAKVKVRVIVTGPAIGENLKVCTSFALDDVDGLMVPFVSSSRLTSSTTMRLEQVPKFNEFTELGSEC